MNQLLFYCLYHETLVLWEKKKLQILEEVSQALSRSKRAVGLIIAGTAVLITLIASTTASVIALTQEVKMATFVNHLDKTLLLF